MSRLLLLCGLIAALLPGGVFGQSYTMTPRAHVVLPGAFGMGDAVVALPMRASMFFYNPAHVAHATRHITFLGVNGTISTNLDDQLRFYEERLDPVIKEGLENLENDDLKALYDEALAIGWRQAFAGAQILGPSGALRIRGIGVGGGLFAQSHVRYRFSDGGGGLPVLDMAGIADAMAVATAGLDLRRFGLPALSIGLTGKFTRRYVTTKHRPLDVFDAEEPVNVFRGNALGVDLGVLYELEMLKRLPGTMYVGFAVYDVLGGRFTYRYDRTSYGTEDPLITAEEEALVNDALDVTTSYRFGVAYRLPGGPGGPFKETGLTLDYVGYSDPSVDQAFLAHLRMGVQTRLSVLSLQAGLNQGYPTLGGGLHLAFFHLYYAFYGLEEGRFPGQVPSWRHTVQVSFGL